MHLTDVSTEYEPWVATLRQLNDLFKELTELLTGRAKRLTGPSLWWEKVTQRLQSMLTNKSVEEDMTKIERFKSRRTT